MGGAGAAAQHPVAVAEEHLGILPVRVRLETRVAGERARRPFPDLAGALELVPGRRLLPLDLGRQARVVRAGEGVGLEPADVDDGGVRAPASAASWWVMSYSLLPRPALVGPPLAALVAAALGEGQPGGVGDRRAADREARGRLRCGAGARCRRRSRRRPRRARTGPRRSRPSRSPSPSTGVRAGEVRREQAREPHRLQHRLGVLELVADHQLVQLAVAHRRLERALAHLRHVLAAAPRRAGTRGRRAPRAASRTRRRARPDRRAASWRPATRWLSHRSS